MMHVGRSSKHVVFLFYDSLILSTWLLDRTSDTCWQMMTNRTPHTHAHSVIAELGNRYRVRPRDYCGWATVFVYQSTDRSGRTKCVSLHAFGLGCMAVMRPYIGRELGFPE